MTSETNKPSHLLHRIFGRDEIRVPLQTTVAVLLAFIGTLFISRENLSWGVFSALFVMQASVGGTITNGAYRIIGAIFGAVIGVIAVLLPGDGYIATLLRLVGGVSIMSVISYRWPELAYGLVTATIIIVSPNFYVLEEATGKVIAIGIGTLSGVVAATAMFPVSAHRRANHHLEQALHSGSQLLKGTMSNLLGEKNKEQRDTIESASYHLSRAREITNQVYSGSMSIGTPLKFPKDILHEVEYFRDTLALVNRFGKRPYLEIIQQEMRQRMQDFCAATESQIYHLAIAIGSRAHCEIKPDLQSFFEQFCEDINSLLENKKLNRIEREHLIAIKLVWGKTYENLTRLCELVNEKNKKD